MKSRELLRGLNHRGAKNPDEELLHPKEHDKSGDAESEQQRAVLLKNHPA